MSYIVICLQTFSANLYYINNQSKNIEIDLCKVFLDHNLPNYVFKCGLFLKQDILIGCWEISANLVAQEDKVMYSSELLSICTKNSVNG